MKGMCVPFAEVERLMAAKDVVIATRDEQIRLKDAAIVALTDELTRIRAWVAKEDE